MKAVSSGGLKKYFQSGLALFAEVVTTVGVMDDANFLPNDLAACQRLLLADFQQSVELEQQVAEAKQQAAELSRVLDETAASYQELQPARRHTRRTGLVPTLDIWPTTRAYRRRCRTRTLI